MSKTNSKPSYVLPMDKGDALVYNQCAAVMDTMESMLDMADRLINQVKGLYYNFFNDNNVDSPVNWALWKTENELSVAIAEVKDLRE